MSSLSTLPKGDSAWLLRKSIQRIMQQVSVLETNIGSSTTGNSANTQVIFNDNGTLRGDTGLTYDKSADRLSFGAGICYGLLTSASATITGDLTVATDRLKVVTGSTAIQTGATTQLQVGTTAWPSTVIGKSGSRSLFGNTGEVVIWSEAAPVIGNYSTLFVTAKTGAGATTMGGLQIRAGIENASNSDGFVSLWTSNSAAGGFVERYKIDSTGVATWSNVGGVAGTAMTLNATGLGVGNAPVAALDVYKVANDTINRTNATFCFGQMTGLGAGLLGQQSVSAPYQFNLQAANAANSVQFPLVLQPNGGNVGIGVTPSAWGAGYKALQLGNGLSLMGSTINGTIAGNAWFDGTNWKYITANPATLYYASFNANGSHVWSISSGVPSVGGNVSLTNAMTLDASGNLLVGQPSVGEAGIVSIKGANGLGAEATLDGGSTYNAKYSGTGTGYFGYFKYGATLVGTIASTGAGNCTFNQVSDYRLKEDVQPIVGALNRINSLKPSTYKWKINGSAGEGFLAHELAAGVPLAVTGEKDAVNEDGSVQPQQVDLSKVVPILVAAIQELTARVQTLETR